MEDMPRPRDTFMLTRGAYDKHGSQGSAGHARESPPRCPGVAAGNRLGLARWLVSPENPLTARVTVNRLWQQFFGTGLVKTTRGLRRPGRAAVASGAARLAGGEFMTPERGREAAASGLGYQAHHPADRHQRDLSPVGRSDAGAARARSREPPAGRGPRYRLPVVDDPRPGAGGQRPAAPALGGPPVKPYQPAGVWEEATFGNKRYQQDHGEALYRRSLYTFWRRIVGPTMFFDVGEPADLHREADAHQHAAARPRHAQRRHLRRGRPRAGPARAASTAATDAERARARLPAGARAQAHRQPRRRFLPAALGQAA